MIVIPAQTGMQDVGYAVHTEKSAGARYAAACIPYKFSRLGCGDGQKMEDIGQMIEGPCRERQG